ncbi:MAG TPA: hypothetical protein VHI78_01245, partial [Bacteroidales bacterium]|nr:hypothetical protein [Bacteroidales bacterium]
MERPLILILPSALNATSGVFFVLSISRFSIKIAVRKKISYVAYTPIQKQKLPSATKKVSVITNL